MNTTSSHSLRGFLHQLTGRAFILLQNMNLRMFAVLISNVRPQIMSTNNQLTEWYLNKVNGAWILPSLNPSLSKIKQEHWHISPITTNLNESAHAATNAYTGIGLSLLAAVQG
jgi:hypothetical protein